MPYTYDVALVGTDSAGEPMGLRLNVTPTRAPVPLGGRSTTARSTCFGQADTYSYFQTGMTMTGTLRWGSVAERSRRTLVTLTGNGFRGTPAAVARTGNPRARAHEWRTIHLDNGVDLSVWRQFDRANHNALQPFSGATTSLRRRRTGIRRRHRSRRHQLCALAGGGTHAGPAAGRGALHARSASHHVTTARPRPDRRAAGGAPAHALPIEYMEGPYRYHGTLGGKPVNGFAFYERSLAMYRDWELVDVLATVIDVGELRSLIREGCRDEAVEYLADVDVHPLVDDLIAALRRSILELPAF